MTTAHASQPDQQDIDRLLDLYSAKEHDQVITEAERLIASFPTTTILHLLTAYAHIGREAFEAAAESCRKALAINPAYADALNALGVALMAVGNLEEAVTHFQRALTAKPEDISALTNLGIIFGKQRKLDEAAICYQKIIALRPDDVSMLAKLGGIYAQQQKLADAVACYRKLLAANPHDIETLDTLGAIERGLGNFDQAIDCFRRVLAVNPRHISALTNLGTTLLKQEKTGEAYACFQKLLTYDLNEARTLHVVRCLSRMGRLNSSPISIVRAAGALELSSVKGFIKDTPERCPHRLPATAVSNGPIVSNLSDMTHRPTGAFSGIPAYLLKITDGECIWPNILLSGDTLIDSNNGYGSLEIVGLSQNDQALRVKTVDGKLRFQLTDAHDRMEVTEPVGVLTAVPNYSAWLLGELPRIALYKKLSPEIKIALHGDARHFHFQSLALFGIEKHQVIVVDKQSSIVGGAFYYATPTFMHQNMSFESIGMLRAHFLSAHKSPSQAGKSLYISRSKLGLTHDRRIQNETEVEGYLAGNGFDIVHPQELSFLDQAQAFASARRIVAPFGAALANAIFCKKNAPTCMIQTKHTPEFDRLFQWLGTDIFHLTPQRQKVRMAAFQSQAFEFTVSLDELRKFVHATA